MTDRPPPPVVVPLTHAGIRYQQDESLQPAGPGSPRGAYLAAFDAETGSRLWYALIYRLDDVPDSPLDMDRHFKSLNLLPDASGIEVEDECGFHYLFDFATRVARDVSSVPDRHESQEDPLAWVLPTTAPVHREDSPFEFPSSPGEP
ncbi:MAG TPA: hypothetical protein VF457_00285 [Burkholderiaceae bacterium]